MQTEQWELVLLTLFEIATLTIPTAIGSNKINMIYWQKSIRLLLFDEKVAGNKEDQNSASNNPDDSPLSFEK